MNFAFNEEQSALKEVARRFLADHSASAQIRAHMESDLGFDPQLWNRIGEEMGWQAMTIPEAYGGFGLSEVEMVAILEEMGRVLLCAPFLSSICLAARLIELAGTEEQKQRWLPSIADGSLRAALAWTEAGQTDDAQPQTTANAHGDGWVLTGTKAHVLDGCSAQLIVVVAQQLGVEGPTGRRLLVVDSDSPGLSRTAVHTLDTSRRQAELVFDGVVVPGSSLLSGSTDPHQTFQTVLDLARVALAAEQVGGAEACLDMAVDYAKVRTQFSRPIGTFQSIKHKCADMLLAVESARSAAYHAGWIAAHQPEELSVAAAVAQSYCSDAFFHCAAENIQIHGGIGFTWEHDAHFFFKRAQSSSNLLGSANWHRERLAQHLGL